MTDRLTGSASRSLLRWPAAGEAQELLRRAFLEHLDEHAEGWSRGCRGAHLTASALICAPTERQVLLVLHRRLGRWLQTGGHIEAADADPAAAALREATEESGLSNLDSQPLPLLLDRHTVPCGGVAAAFHLDLQFLVRADRAAAPACSEESEQVRWFDPDALPEVDDSVRRLVAAASRRLDWGGVGDDHTAEVRPVSG